MGFIARTTNPISCRNAQSLGRFLRKPFDETSRLARRHQTAIDRVVIAPHHVGQFALRNTRLDFCAIQPLLALNIETVAAAGDRTMGIHRTGPALALQHRTHDRPLRPRVRQLRSQVLVFARAHFQKCHYNSANCSGAAGFSIPNA